MKMTHAEALEYVKANLKCTDFLENDKNKRNMYICPYCGSGTHNNHTGALKYYSDSNTWACFACPTENGKVKGGDVLDLIQQTKGVDFNKALSLAADILNIEIAPYNVTEGAKNDFKHKPKEIPAKKENAPQGTLKRVTEAKDYSEYYKKCEENLATSEKAISYLVVRGISFETAAALHIGYDEKADPAQSNNPTPRIIIPTSKDHYIGRRIDGISDYAKLNSKGSAPKIFNMNALENDQDIVFITEGAFDAMSLIQIGYNAIALNSVSNTNLLIKCLEEKPIKKKFIICFDNDQGETAKNTKARSSYLNATLKAMGYNTIEYNVAGDAHDINDLLNADYLGLIARAKAAVKEVDQDELTDFFNTIQTEAYKPYPTGLSFFDDLIGGGMERQTLLILLAAPGTGKTTLCQQLAECMALHNKPVIYFNFEMSKSQLLSKAISYHLAKSRKAYMTAKEILHGYEWDKEEKDVIEAAIEIYRKKSLPYIKYNPANIKNDIDDIISYLETIGDVVKAKGEEAPAVIIDYLHLVSAKGLDGQELIKKVIVALKDYAIRYNTFVIAISATNRDTNGSGAITLSSGRDSSNIEYTGDYVLSLNYYDVDVKKVDVKDNKAMEQLQNESYRRLVLRILKGRMTKVGSKRNIYYDAAHNIFYGEYDFMPFDENRIKFNETPNFKNVIIL